MQARGNGPSYTAQGSNYVRSILTYGPLSNLLAKSYGWQNVKQTSYDQGFHTYTIEWTENFIKSYVDSRLTAMLALKVCLPILSFSLSPLSLFLSLSIPARILRFGLCSEFEWWR